MPPLCCCCLLLVCVVVLLNKWRHSLYRPFHINHWSCLRYLQGNNLSPPHLSEFCLFFYTTGLSMSHKFSNRLTFLFYKTHTVWNLNYTEYLIATLHTKQYRKNDSIWAASIRLLNITEFKTECSLLNRVPNNINFLKNVTWFCLPLCPKVWRYHCKKTV